MIKELWKVFKGAALLGAGIGLFIFAAVTILALFAGATLSIPGGW